MRCGCGFDSQDHRTLPFIKTSASYWMVVQMTVFSKASFYGIVALVLGPVVNRYAKQHWSANQLYAVTAWLSSYDPSH